MRGKEVPNKSEDTNDNLINIGFYILIFISSCIQITPGEIATQGFVIAFDVVIFGIFLVLHSKEEGAITYYVVVTTFLSPMSRFILTYYTFPSGNQAVGDVFPDMIFFLVYGLVYSMLQVFVPARKSYLWYIPVVLVSEIYGNMIEKLFRFQMFGGDEVTWLVLYKIFVVAAVRTALVFIIIFALRMVMKYNAKQQQWKNLLSVYDDMTTLSEELVMIRKNMTEIENLMAEAYEFNRVLSQEHYPPKISSKAHEIAVRMHEIKGEYRNMLFVIEKLTGKKELQKSLGISFVAEIVKGNVTAFARSRGFDTEINLELDAEFDIAEPYKMLSIIRNLVTNSVEAIDGTPGGEVIVYTKRAEDEIIIGVRDNGPGIDDETKVDMFISGYSSKFDYETGYIQRGLGLYLVKNYVEDDFGGRIMVDSDGESYTDIKIYINKDRL